MTKNNIAALGFTLLEVLVVILIIGISLSFISLNVAPRHQIVGEEASRLAALLTLAQEEAILSGQEYALELGLHQYRFVCLQGDEWQHFADDEVLRSRALPAALQLDVSIAGERVSLSTLQLAEQESPPRIYLLSSGEVTPFVITLVDLNTDMNNCFLLSLDGTTGKFAVNKNGSL